MIILQIIAYLTALTADYLFSRFIPAEGIFNFYIIIPTVLMVVLHHKSVWVLFVIMGVTVDSISAGFFGINGLAYFLTGLHLYWAVTRFPSDAPLVSFAFGLLAQVSLHIYLIIFYYMAERLIFVDPFLYKVVILSVIPSAAITIPIAYLLKKLLPYIFSRKLIQDYGRTKN